jgi:hypothetical protein
MTITQIFERKKNSSPLGLLPFCREGKVSKGQFFFFFSSKGQLIRCAKNKEEVKKDELETTPRTAEFHLPAKSFHQELGNKLYW